jgi:hypothetical protein
LLEKKQNNKSAALGELPAQLVSDDEKKENEYLTK